MRPGIVGAASIEVIVPGNTGWVSPGTVANHTGTGDVDWASINNVKNTSTSVATAFCNGTYHYIPASRYIRATNFNFSAIPSGAVLSRFWVRMRWKTDAGTSSVTGHWIAFEGSVNGSSSSNVAVPTTIATYERGSDAASNYLWSTSGITTDDVINDSTFGCFVGGLAAQFPYEVFTLSMEYVQMKIEWVAP